MKCFLYKSLLAVALTVLLFQNSFASENTLEKAKVTIANLLQKNEWADRLPSLKPVELPVALKRTKNNIDYILAITDIRFFPEGAEIDLILSLTTPYKDADQNRLYFSASNVKWSESGGFSEENLELVLLEDFKISFGKNIELIIKGQKDSLANSFGNTTFATLACGEFEKLFLSADLLFDQSLIVPVGCKSDCEQIKTSFCVEVEGWSDLVVECEIPEFELASLKGWIFESENVVFDFSETRNSESFVFPRNYGETYYSDYPEIWRGLSIKQVKVSLPKAFQRKGGSALFTIEAEDVLIDEMGFSGYLHAKDVILPKYGHVGGWDFTMDTLEVAYCANKLQKAYFNGYLGLPVDTVKLPYYGRFDEDETYLMQIDLVDSLNLSLWRGSRLHLFPESYIKLTKEDDKFLSQACLHGRFSLLTALSDSSTNKLLQIPDVSFYNMILRNQKPYFSIESFSYDKSISLAQFPAKIDKLGLSSHSDEDVTLSADLSLELTSSSDGGYRGNCGFDIVAKLENSLDNHEWNFESFNFRHIELDVDHQAFGLQGRLAVFENNTLYGTGFGGGINLKIKNPQIEIKAAATFGKTADFRYWFVDGLVDMGRQGIPIFAGLQINGFGGGAYQKMKQVPTVKVENFGLGVSTTGIKYVPDEATRLGIKAAVAISTQNDPSVLNGQLELELAFNAKNGLNSIELRGNAKALDGLEEKYFSKLNTKIEKLGQFSSDFIELSRQEDVARGAPITACAKFQYDFINDCFKGSFDTYMDVDLIKGQGKTDLYFDKDKWYFHVGHPDRRFNVSMGIGGVGIKTGIYLMAGHDMPAMPSPPSHISSALSSAVIRSLQENRGIESIQQGRGLAFGSNLGLNTGALSFLMFFGQFQADLGFDFMLKNYGQRSCDAKPDQKIGLGGWYGSGQAYAYLLGKMGIRINLFGESRSLTIFDVKNVALLQAQLPNPTWFSGQLASSYNILNGLIKGQCNFKFEIGEKCEFPQDIKLADFTVISDVRPVQDSRDADVHSIPQVSFNLPIGVVSLNDIAYKTEVSEFSVKVGQSPIAGQMEWNEDKTELSFIPDELLPAKKTMTLSVKLAFYEKKVGVWQKLLNSNNQIHTEAKTIQFTTGEQPEMIHLSNILFSYPVIDQKNFYVGEYMNGYLSLKRGQSELFEKTGQSLQIKIETSSGNAIYKNLSYDKNKKQLNWAMPGLNKNTTYTLSLISISSNSQQTPNSAQNYVTSYSDEAGNELEILNKQLLSTKQQNKEHLIFKYTFTTSAFSTFSENLSSLTFYDAQQHTLLAQNFDGTFYSLPDANYLSMNSKTRYTFEDAELFGTAYTNNLAMVVGEALLDNNTYFIYAPNQFLYKPYNFSGLVALSRAPNEEVVPKWAIQALQLSPWSLQFPWTYDLPLFYQNDLNEIQAQLTDQQSKGKDISQYKHLLNWTLPNLIKGSYFVRFRYRLPCGQLGTFLDVNYKYSY